MQGSILVTMCKRRGGGRRRGHGCCNRSCDPPRRAWTWMLSRIVLAFLTRCELSPTILEFLNNWFPAASRGAVGRLGHTGYATHSLHAVVEPALSLASLALGPVPIDFVPFVYIVIICARGRSESLPRRYGLPVSSCCAGPSMHPTDIHMVERSISSYAKGC